MVLPFEARNITDPNLLDHQGHGHQPVEPEFYFNMSPFVLPQELDGMSTDSFLDSLLNQQPPQFPLAGPDEFDFTAQHSPSVVNIDNSDPTFSEPNSSSTTNTTLPRCSVDAHESSDQVHSSKVVDNVPMLECSAELAEHL